MKQQCISLPTSALYEAAEPYMDVMCGFSRRTKQVEKSRRAAMKVRAALFDHTETPCLVAPIGKECIGREHFAVEGGQIACTVLGQLKQQGIYGGYAFMLHAPVPDLSALPIAEMYLADCWQTCLVDAGCDVLRQLLLEQAETTLHKKLYITNALAPGMYGIKAENVKDFFTMMDGSQIGIRLLESGMMDPVKSFVGFFVLLDRQVVIAETDCAQCMSGHKHCAYCKNYAASLLKQKK